MKKLNLAFLVSLVAFGCEAAVSTLSLPILLLYLPREHAGIWMIFGSLGMLLSVPLAGLNPATVRAIAQSHNEKVHTLRAPNAISRSYSIALTIGWIIAAAVAACYAAPFLADSTTGIVIVILSWAVYTSGWSLRALAGKYYAMMDGIGEVGKGRIGNAVGALIVLLAFASLLPLYGTLLAVSISYLLGGAVNLAYALRKRREYEHVIGRAEAGLRLSSEDLLRDGGYLAWLALSGFVVNYGCIFVVGQTAGTATVALFAPIARLALMISAIACLSNSLCVPFLTKFWVGSDAQSFRSMLTRHMTLPVMIYGALTLPIALFPQTVIEAWLGEGNFITATFVRLFLLWGLLATLHITASQALIAVRASTLVKEATLSVVFVLLPVFAFSDHVEFIPGAMVLGLSPITVSICLRVLRLNK